LRQITLLKPKLILAVGRIAAQFLLNTNEAIGKLRGREFSYGPYQTPLLVTYHPAYLLRAPREKSKAWEDLQRVVKYLEQLQPK
jgi:uracil-DNA glycosylase family 4